MIELTNSLGATVRVEGDEQAKFWEERGYKRADSDASTTKAASKKPSSKSKK